MRKIVYYLFISFLFISCGGGENVKPEDKAAPTMSISSPLENDIVNKTNFLTVSGVLQDDMDLKSLEVSLQAPPSTKGTNGINDPWVPNAQIIQLSGKKVTLDTEQLFGEAIPYDCLSGKYSLNLLLKDSAGKSVTKKIAINIQ